MLTNHLFLQALQRVKASVIQYYGMTADYCSDGDQLVIKEEEIPRNDFKIYHSEPSAKPNSIWFRDCNMPLFPSTKTLLDCVENLTSLIIERCKLSRISPENLNGLQNLTCLQLFYNNIEYLPPGLFKYTPKLQMVSFELNKIKYIDENILEPLSDLMYFSLCENSAIDAVYYKYVKYGGWTLAQLKEEIKNKCKIPELTDILMKLTLVEAQTKKIDELEKEVGRLNETCAAQNAKISILEAQQNQDFTVKVSGEDIRVNKALLIANSPVLEKMIRDNPEAARLELRDLSEKTFNELLKFMQTKSPPSQEANLIEIFAACGRLEMKELMDITAGMLMEKITADNAPKIIALGAKYGNRELQAKAIAELHKKFFNV